jgi:hypothetical protein
MTSDNDHDRERDHDENTRRGKTIAPALRGAALASTSLTEIAAAFNRVDLTSVSSRSAKPLMLFKRDGNGTWIFGAKQIVPEDGSRWACNVLAFQWGYICWGDGSKKLGECLVPVSQPKPDVTTLPDHGFPWQEEMSIDLKCTTGADAGIEVIFKAATVGTIQAIAGLIEEVRDRLNRGMHDDKIVPIVVLERDSYQHSQYGRVYTPVLRIVDWMTLEGPSSDGGLPSEQSSPPSPPPPAAEQPRRRRSA